MGEVDDTPMGNLVANLQAAMAINPLMHQQVVQFWETQRRMLDALETYQDGWFARRREAVDTALDAVNTMMGEDTAGPSEAMEAVSDWMQQSAARVAEDYRDVAELFAQCGSDTLRSGVEAEQEAIEETIEQLQDLRKEHAMPV
ncbi:phasin family protein [Yoonia sp.]|uniref:phasin family protein n=1 Tax=Yoonia sp. TaxID=2212373 RepID=UPI001A0DFDDD|nr:phasin family protein [Yoonia sp.]MBE0414121.1 phasin family protein [Yoonia sp.]